MQIKTTALDFLSYDVVLEPPVIGKCSCFGGPTDLGVGQDEGLALFDHQTASGAQGTGLFLDPVRFDRGLARQLNPAAYYCAMRWDYSEESVNRLRRAIVMVTTQAGIVIWVRPVDWGPGKQTGRVIDLSPAALVAGKIATDDVVRCELILPS